MAAITEQAIRELAGFRGSDAPVTSCYLDVDGRRYVRHQDYEQQLDRLLREAKGRANGELRGSLAEDLERIEGFVKAGFDRSRVRGLALFSCSAAGFFRSISLPVPVLNRLVVNQTPAVRQLEQIVATNQRFGVLVADRQRARMFVFELGELADKSELFEALPRHDDDGGEWDRDHVRDHQAAMALQHLKHAADVALRVFQDTQFDHLIVGAPEEIANQLEQQLHPYVRDRVVARLSVPVAASDDEIRAAALDVEAEVERRREAQVVERLRDAVGGKRLGVAGFAPTLDALRERRVDTLLVSRGYEEPGWRCDGCGQVAQVGRTCPSCGLEMHQVDDVVEEAIDDALAHSCTVMVCDGNADLDVLGRIGALLRF